MIEIAQKSESNLSYKPPAGGMIYGCLQDRRAGHWSNVEQPRRPARRHVKVETQKLLAMPGPRWPTGSASTPLRSCKRIDLSATEPAFCRVYIDKERRIQNAVES